MGKHKEYMEKYRKNKKQVNILLNQQNTEKHSIVKKFTNVTDEMIMERGLDGYLDDLKNTNGKLDFEIKQLEQEEKEKEKELQIIRQMKKDKITAKKEKENKILKNRERNFINKVKALKDNKKYHDCDIKTFYFENKDKILTTYQESKFKDNIIDNQFEDEDKKDDRMIEILMEGLYVV